MSKKPRTQINVPVTGNDPRDNVINRKLDSVPNITQYVKHLIYAEIVGLTIRTAPLYTYIIFLKSAEGYSLERIFKATDDLNAIQQAMTYAELNQPDINWHVTSVTQL